jgi:hypothetical protein
MMDRIAVCFLSGDTVHADFAMSLLMLVAHTMQRGVEITAINTKCTLIADGRNKAVEGAVGSGCSHILFIDSDMVVPHDTAVRLLSHRKDIIGATYMSRRAHPVHGHSLMHEELQGDKTLGIGVRRVLRMPTGCLMIKASLFLEIPKPWFWFGNQPSGEPIGEDYAFCHGATQLGREIWLDADLSHHVGHIGAVTFTPGMFGHA